MNGDCREMLKTLPDDSVHCCVSSPPYWGLRDYGTGTWEGGDATCNHVVGEIRTGLGMAKLGELYRGGGKKASEPKPLFAKDECPTCGARRVDRQLGLEPDYRDHIAAMVEVFREVRRVLRPDGTLWLNYGDCYASSVNGRSAADTKAAGNDDRTFRDKPFSTVQGVLKPKDLVMMPARIAIALQEDGWWLRSDIIWSKPNPMPESITDRPATSHEHVFLLTKSPRYFYDAEAIREESRGQTPGDLDGGRNFRDQENAITFRGGSYVNGKPGPRTVKGNVRIKIPGGWEVDPGAHGTVHRKGRTVGEYQEIDIRAGRNARNVWTIATAPYADAHFATFPPTLAERCIKAGTSERGCCSACGAPLVRQTIAGAVTASGGKGARYHEARVDGSYKPGTADDSMKARERITTGWSPSCQCDAAVVPCTVLDPFAGAFTSLLVADRLQRDGIGIELNPEYCEMARRRLTKDAGLFTEIAAPPAAPDKPSRANLFT